MPRALTAAFLLVLSTCGAAAAGANPPDLRSLLQSYRSLRLATKGWVVENHPARCGHMEFDFEQGEVFPLQGERGETLGLYFVGKGRYTYRSEDPADRQVMESNLAHFSRRRSSSTPR